MEFCALSPNSNYKFNNSLVFIASFVDTNYTRKISPPHSSICQRTALSFVIFLNHHHVYDSHSFCGVAYESSPFVALSNRKKTSISLFYLTRVIDFEATCVLSVSPLIAGNKLSETITWLTHCKLPMFFS